MKLFKRPRPTGRQSAPAGAKPRLTQYYQTRPPTATPPPRPRRRGGWRDRLRQLIRRLVWLTLAALFIYNLLLAPPAKVSVDNALYRPASFYSEAVDRELGRLTNRNKLTVDVAAIQKRLKAQAPEIATVSINTPIIGRTSSVKLHIAAPALLLNAQNGAYLVDEQGLAVAKAESLPALNNLPRLDDQSGLPAQIGQPILNTSAIAFVNTLISQTKHAGVAVAALSLPPLAQELDLTTSDRGYRVKFYLGGDALTQTGQFLAARHSFDASGNQPAEYLDVRVAGKIFYK